jgi:tape measure domain-containing protein
MSEKIKSSDIFEGDIFKIVVDSAELAKTKISELNEELVKVGTSFKKELKSVKTDNVKEINDLIVKVKELTSAVETQTKVNKANEIAIREAKKTSEQALREEEKTKREALKTQEQINKSDERALANKKKLSGAYKELSDNTRDLKNESKRLGAEMLELEKQGKKNSAEYYKLSKQYKEVTRSAVEGDKALKKLDERVGDNFRKVGNYERVVNGLRLSLIKLGLAFGVFDGIRALIDTQVKLDSLNLALKNVSGSTKEYQANFAFLKDLSLSYGQDLLVLMDTYKNFIASTSSSNLSLAERKRIYESVIKAGSALALSNDNVKGSLLAISQMFSKGTVSAEELRQQLGERLPGAFGIMAESMGVSEQELGKLMKNGQVLADEVMPRFAIMLERHFGANASERLKTLGGAWNVLKNNITLYFDQAQKNVNINKTLAYVLRTLGENIGSVLNESRQLITAFITFKAVLLANSIRISILNEGFLNIVKNAVKGGNAISGFSKSLRTIGFVVVIDGLVKLTEHFLELANGTNIARKSYERYLDSTNRGNRRATEFLTVQNDELNNYRKTQQALLDTKQITEKVFKERMDLKEKERKKDIQDKVDELKREAKHYQDKRLIYRNQFEGQKPTIPTAPIGVKSQLLQSGGLTYAITNLVGGEKSDEQKSYERAVSRYNAELKAYNEYVKLGAEANRVFTEMQKLQNDLADSETLNTKFKGKSGTTNKDIAEHTKEIRDLNTEYNATNIYLSRQLEILKDIDKIKSEDKMQEAIDKTRIALDKEEKSVNLTGKYNAGAVQTAIELEQKAKKEFEEKRFQAEKEDKKIRDTKTFNDELIAVEEQEKTKLKQLSEIQSDTERKLVDARINLKKKNLSKSGKQELKAEIENLKAQLEINKDYAKQIKEGADKEKAQVYENDIKRQEDTNLEIEGLQKNHEKNMANIKRDSVEKMQDTLDKLELIRAEKRLEVIKNTAESVNNLIQKSLEHYIDLAERRIDILDKRMERMSTQADFLREKAVSGSIQAQESLAQLDVQQLETEKQKINEQKSIQKLQIAMTVFQAYSNNIQNAKVGENPFTKTLTDITLLNQLANTVSNGLPAYFDGTEDTGSNGQGVDGKGGFHAVLHPNERVIPKALNSKIGDLSNLEIAKLAEDFHRGEVMRKGDGAMQLNVGSWSTDAIVSKLESLENTIKNKPESNIELGEIVGGVMHIMETKKTGNTKVRNISRFS